MPVINRIPVIIPYQLIQILLFGKEQERADRDNRFRWMKTEWKQVQ